MNHTTLKRTEVRLKNGETYKYFHGETSIGYSILSKNKHVKLEKHSDDLTDFFLLENGEIIGVSSLDTVVFPSWKEFKLDIETSKPILKPQSKERVFTTKDFRLIEYIQLNKEEAKVVINKGFLLTKINTGLYYIYNLKDDYLLMHKSEYSIFLISGLNSCHLLVEYLQSHSVLQGINHYEDKFIENIDVLNGLFISNMQNHGYTPNLFDFSFKSLNILDAFLEGYFLNDKFFCDNYLNIIAYVGSVACKEYNYEWDLVHDLKNDEWMPYLKDKRSKKNIPFFIQIYDTLKSYERGFYYPLLDNLIL